MMNIPAGHDGFESSQDTIAELCSQEGYLRRIARRFVRCEADVDDLVQDTLLRAFRARARFTPGTSMRAWTTTILRRVFLTQVATAGRRKLRTCADVESALGARAARDDAAVGADPEAVAEALDGDVQRALDTVPA